MASKKSTSAPSTPDYGITAGPTSATTSTSPGSKGKNTAAPSAYRGGTQMGYDVGAPVSAFASPLAPIGMVGSDASQATQDAARAQSQATANALRTSDPYRNVMGGGRVSFPDAAAGGVPGQNSREGYDERGNYIVNGPGNYDAQGNYIYDQQVAREAEWANMASEPTGPAVNINGVMMQPMRRADGSVYTTALDANGQPQQPTYRTDMGI